MLIYKHRVPFAHKQLIVAFLRQIPTDSDAAVSLLNCMPKATVVHFIGNETFLHSDGLSL